MPSYKYTKRYETSTGTKVFTREYDYSEKNKEVHKCECGGKYQRMSAKRHRNSKRHRRYIGLGENHDRKTYCVYCDKWYYSITQHNRTKKHIGNMERFEKATMPIPSV
jgi:hypothetical protein